MGPRLVSRGNFCPTNLLKTIYRPSMGPRLVSRGNQRTSAGFAVSLIPSMGPRLVSRGNGLDENTLSRFLLALQWGRGS